MTLFISETDLLENSFIEENIDVKILGTAVKLVQNIQVKEILGKTLYNDFHEEYSNTFTGSTLSQQYQDLHSHIKEFMIHATIVEFMVFNQYKITNKGTLTMRDSLSSALGIPDFENAKNNFESYRNYYKDQLMRFVKDNKLNDRIEDVNIDLGGADSIGWFLDY